MSKRMVGAMTGKERVRRSIELRGPDRIPARISCLPAVWQMYRDDLRQLYKQYDWLNDFGWRPPGRDPGPERYDSFDGPYRAGEEYTDNWGTVWHNACAGLHGQIKGFPLADWDALPTYHAPDPLLYEENGGLIDWEAIGRGIAQDHRQHYILGDGDLLWQRLFYLRGLERVMIDLAEGRPEVEELIDLIVDHNVRKIRQWLE